MKKALAALVLIPALVLGGALPAAAGEKVAYTTYTYTYDGEPISSPHAYVPGAILDLSEMTDSPLSVPNDLAVGPDGRVVVADTGNARLIVLKSDDTLETVVDHFVYGGEKRAFIAPKGVFIAGDGRIYVADTDGRCIVVLTPQLTCEKVIEAPQSTLLPADFSFLPVRVAVDSAGRIYCICSGNIYGVVALDNDGGFETFIGAQKVTPNLSERFWRMFMTKEQKRRTRKTVPSNYNSIAVDEKGFLYVTSSYSNTAAVMQAIRSRSTDNRYAVIKKLTPSGDDVLSRTGFFPPGGDVKVQLSGSGNDVNTDIRYGPSVITDVALGENGVYSLMDHKRGKIFTYDTDGNLLYAFGGTGYQPGLFRELAAVDYKGGSLYALDGVSGTVTRFDATRYGAKVQQAIALTEERRYEDSVAVYQDILRENNNFDLANIGIAAALMRKGDYAGAMEYYKNANQVTGYSKAYSLYRKEAVGPYLLLIPVAVLLLAVGISAFLARAAKYNLAVAHRRGGVRTWGQELMYVFHVIFHPFDGFWDLKRERRGGVRGATVILLVTALTMMLRAAGTGYICTGRTTNDTNVLLTALTFVGIVLLFCVANWCLTSLMSGEGTFRDIYVAGCYALLPVALFTVPATLLSHFVTAQEIMFVNFLLAVGFLWTALLLFCAVQSTHAYTPGKNVLTIVCTLVGMVLIAFLLMLFVNLIGRMTTFIRNIVNEIAFRT